MSRPAQRAPAAIPFAHRIPASSALATALAALAAASVGAAPGTGAGATGAGAVSGAATGASAATTAAAAASAPGASAVPTFLPDADGYVRAWLVAGPYAYDKLPTSFPSDSVTPAYARDFLAEETGTGESATRAVLAAGGAFRPFVSDEATVDILDLLKPPKTAKAPRPSPKDKAARAPASTYAVVYAYAEIISPAPRDGFLRLGSDDGARVWVDGTEVAALGDGSSHPHQPDRLSAPIKLRAGATPVLVKIDQRKGAWRFSLRLCDADDRALPGVTIRLPAAPDGRTAAADLAAAALRAARTRFTATATADGFDVAVAVDAPPARAPGGAPLVTATLAAAGLAPAPVPLLPSAPLRFHLGGLHAGATARAAVRLAAGAPALAPAPPGGPVPALREDTLALPFRAAHHALLADAEAFLAALRTARADLFAPRPRPRLGVWAELGADGGAPLAAPGSADPHGALDAGGVATLEWFAAELRALLELGDSDAAFVARRAAELKRLVKAARAGKDPLAGRHGPMLLAYRSALDGSVQPYALYVPKAYKPGARKPLPLFVGLHGLGGRPGRFLRYMTGVPLGPGETSELGERAFPAAPALPDAPVFLVTPYGRGDIAFRGPGEDDVLSVIAAVEERFAIDRDRVHLTGASMGGIGVFELAVHRPDVFASAIPLCGAADVRMYASVGDRPLRDFEAAVLGAAAAVEWAPNLRGLPVWCVHGSKDTTNPSERSRVMIDRMTALGLKPVWDEPPLGHDVWDYTYADGALWKKSPAVRTSFPAHATYTTGDLRWRGAYWVRVDEAAARDHFATLDATRDGARARVTVTTANVTAFSLLLAPAVARDDDVEVLVDGASAWRGSPAALPARVLSLRRPAPGAPFALAAAPPALAPPAGPLGVLSFEPRLYVYATGDPVMRARARALAERLAAPGGMDGPRFPVKPDFAVTADDLATRDVVAIGNADTNWVIAVAARSGRLPVAFEPGALLLGGARYAGRDVGAVFAVPSPFHAGRALIIYGAVGPAGLGLARHLPRYLPDYVVYDRRIAAALGGAVLGGRDVLAAGFF